ncbi:MAG TPA: outer membrane beta-barrel protein [Chryseolinea sp.]
MERRKFEDSFKEAFEGAEMDPSDNVWSGIERELEKADGSFKQAFYGAQIDPSDNVWTGIELELEKAEGERTRRRLLFYKMLAAASVTFALCFAGIGYYVIDRKTAALNEQLAASSKTEQTQDALNTPAETTRDSNAMPGEQPSEQISQSETSSVSSLSQAHSTSGLVANANQSTNALMEVEDSPDKPVAGATPAVDGSSKPERAGVDGKYDDRQIPSFYTTKNPTLVIPKNEVDPGALLLAQLAAEEQKYAQLDKKEKERKAEKLWTSVGFAAGAFSSVNTGVSPAAANNAVAFTNSSVPDKQAKASGISYSVGVNVGTKLSKRWTIQGGVNYLTQSSDYIATNVVAENNFQTLKAESINELDKLPELADAYASSKLTPTFPYSVNNNVKFFSVPVQAGYLLVNQKFGLQLNAGVSTDLFLENTITPEAGSVNKTTQGRGEDSPYRSVNFSGLMGTEFSYRFGKHYRVALNPGLRYPLNSVYKNDVGIQSTPLTFDVGLRFKYIFH